ncbi:COG1470 family protein [Streptomyces huasconensis]|uniref:COG1470 family protein n=1 Tax=Streptomyces huasconensis TaxID=1854574 RepID=UPI0036FA3549
MPSSAARAAVALCAAVLVLAPVMPAHADSGGSPDWSVAPSTGDGPRAPKDGRPAFYAEGAPGTVLRDTVSVSNPGPKPRTVSLRGADVGAGDTGSGALSVASAKERPTETGAWIRLARRRVEVPPRTRAEVPFTVTVPEDAVPGDHPGAIVASGGGRTVGVRLHLRVGGPTLPALTVERVKVDQDAGRITYDLVNRGNTVLSPKLAVHADGVLGTLLDRPARPLPVELLPGRRVSLSEPWPDVPALDAAEVRLTATAPGGARDTATASARFVPWGALAGGAAALLAVAGGALHLVRVRGRGRSSEVPEPEAGPERECERAQQPGSARELAEAGTREES